MQMSIPIQTDQSKSTGFKEDQVGQFSQIQRNNPTLQMVDPSSKKNSVSIAKTYRNSQFEEDISGSNYMPLQTANQEILNKVAYQGRATNERNILNKYNKVKRKKMLAPTVANNIHVISMPYYERIALLR